MTVAGWVFRPAWLMACQMASTTGDECSIAKKVISTRIAQIVPLVMNSSARWMALGPRTRNTGGADNMLLAVMREVGFGRSHKSVHTTKEE
uniref:Secreted protein n=1 Tax=Romanomermis culicivorax TaxID=13658 RepID=A0A915KVZ7_ROMCU